MQAYSKLKLIVAVCVFVSQAGTAFAFPVQAQESGDYKPAIVVTTAPSPSVEGNDWPITRIETRRYVDSATGQERVTQSILREIKRPQPAGLNCNPGSASSGYSTAQAFDCGYVGSAILENIGYGGSVTVHVRHYANKFCTWNAGCPQWLYQPYRLEVWWTRPNASWTVQNAVTSWGCYAGCEKCDTSWWSYLWNSASFTPSWQNSTTSTTMVYTTAGGTVWPAMLTTFGGTAITGTSTAKAVYGASNYTVTAASNFIS